MKILYIWKDKYPWDVRVEKVCKALQNAGYEVFILARNKGETKQKEIIDGLNIIRVGEKPTALTLPVPKNPIWKSAIKDTIKEIQPDLIIVREIMLAEVSAKIGRANSIPVIIDMAENYPACMRDWKKYNQNFLSRFAVHILKLPDIVEKQAVNLCDGIIVVCDEQIERLATQYNFPASKISVVHNTPIPSYFHRHCENPHRHCEHSEANHSDKIDCHAITRNDDTTASVFASETKQTTNNKEIATPTTRNDSEKRNRKILCHHGFLSAEKSITNLLLGFEIAAENNDIELIIAGDGECKNDYEELVAKFRNKNKIHFLGAYDYQTLPQILVQSDIGVVPYQISDFNNYTIHNKVFDYFALGKPVLASTVKPLIRILEETKAGLAMDFSTAKSSAIAIETIINADIETMSKNALAAAQNKYNWSVDAKTLCDFIGRFFVNTT